MDITVDDRLENGLQREKESMLASGMVELTKDQLIDSLDKLGYKINKEMSFKYINRGNENKYNAYSCNIIEKDTGLGFAHIEARRDENFNKLQELRKSTFTIVKGRLYEL